MPNQARRKQNNSSTSPLVALMALCGELSPHSQRGRHLKKKRRKKKTLFSAPLFVALMVLFDELMLHLWTGSLGGGHFFTVSFLALGLGGILALITSLFRRSKRQKRFAVILTALLAVLYLAEYFMNDAYQCFMPPATVLDGAGGVATDFASVVVSLLLRNLWRIGLMFLPIILYMLLCRTGRASWQQRSIFGLAGLIFYLLGFCVVQLRSADAALLSDAYNFDSAVRSLGLHSGLMLDLVRGDDTGNGDFVVPNPVLPNETDDPAATDDATTPATDPPVVLGDNVLDLDFEQLAASESSSAIASIHKYVASLTPSKQNEYTGLFKGKNLIFITAEAFSAEVIDPVRTPTLYRLATKGIQFTDYYQPAWGGSTSTGEYSNTIGLVPANGTASIKETTQQDMFLTIGNQLKDLGYYSVAYHNHTYTYYDRNLTHPGLGYDKFIGLGNGMEEGVKKRWPESDREMMEFTVDQYINQQPFNIYYMTVSGHCLYSTSGNNMSSKNYDAVQDLEYSETVKSYLACQMELEYAMRYLVNALEEAGIADDTVIVLATDHYPYGLEKSSTWNNTEDYLSELYGYTYKNNIQRDHSALIIWSGCLEGKNIVVDTPVYSLDILPTLSNLFGVEYDSRLLIGRDVFSDEIPLALWPDYNWKTDKGTYLNKTFTPAEGVTVEDGYVDYINSIVKNKITYSQSVAKQDYFNYVVKALGRS